MGAGRPRKYPYHLLGEQGWFEWYGKVSKRVKDNIRGRCTDLGFRVSINANLRDDVDAQYLRVDVVGKVDNAA